MGYYVSRQYYYYSGEKVVEIEPGGLDYSGADTLVARYTKLGESQEFDDPREAVKAAIAIRDAWRRDEPDESIHISYGQTSGGMGMEHEPDESDDDAKAMEWAEKEWEGLPKCDHCGELRDEKNYYFVADDPELGKFCSDHCSYEVYAELLKETMICDIEDYAGRLVAAGDMESFKEVFDSDDPDFDIRSLSDSDLEYIYEEYVKEDE